MPAVATTPTQRPLGDLLQDLQPNLLISHTIQTTLKTLSDFSKRNNSAPYLFFAKWHVGQTRVLNGAAITDPQRTNEDLLRQFESQPKSLKRADFFDALPVSQALDEVTHLLAPSSYVICTPRAPFLVVYLNSHGADIQSHNFRKGETGNLRERLTAFDSYMERFWVQAPEWMLKERQKFLRPEVV